MIVFHKNLNVLTSSSQPPIHDSGCECRRRITVKLYTWLFYSIVKGEVFILRYRFWSRIAIRITTVMMTLIQLTAFLLSSVMVPWSGRTQGVWPACRSRGTVTHSGVASHHNSHRNGNYELLNNHNCLLKCLLFGWITYDFGTQKIFLLLKIFISLPVAFCCLELPHHHPPSSRHLCTVSKLFCTANPLHTLSNSTEPSCKLSQLTDPQGTGALTLTLGVFVNGKHALQMFFVCIA